MSIHGRGCPQDEPAGLQWLKQAAEGGSLYGIGLLTLHYFTNKLFTKAAESAYRHVHTCVHTHTHTHTHTHKCLHFQ